MSRAWFGLALLALACACEVPPSDETKLEPDEVRRDGLWLSSETADADGERPKLAVSCAADSKAFLSFGTANPPPRPPPLRGVFATVTVDRRPPLRMEMSWGGTSWMPRDMPEAEVRRLALAIADARSVTLDGLDGWPQTPLTWTIDLPEAERRRFRVVCEQTLTAPSPPAAPTAEDRLIAQRRLERTRAYNRRAREANVRRAEACRGHVAAGGDPGRCASPMEILPER